MMEPPQRPSASHPRYFAINMCTPWKPLEGDKKKTVDMHPTDGCDVKKWWEEDDDLLET